MMCLLCEHKGNHALWLTYTQHKGRTIQSWRYVCKTCVTLATVTGALQHNPMTGRKSIEVKVKWEIGQA